MPGIQPMELGQAALGPMVTAQRMDIEAAQAPSQIEHAQSLARLQRAQAGEAELRAQKDRSLMDMARGWTPKPGATQQENLIELGMMSMKAGGLQGAERAFALAEQAGQRAGMEEYYRAQAADRSVKVAEAYDKILANSYASVRDPKDSTQLAFARQMFLQQAQGLPGAEARAAAVEAAIAQHGPVAIRMLHDMGVGQKEVGAEAHRDMLEKLRLEEARRRARMDEFNRALKKQSFDLRARLEAAKEKAGGKDVATPTDRQIAGAKAHLSILGVNEAIEDDVEFTAFARDVASLANVMRKNNQALTEAEAWTRAYQESQKSVGRKPRKILGVGVGERGGYTPPAVGDGPKVGEVRRGFRFKGGDPSKQESWEAVK